MYKIRTIVAVLIKRLKTQFCPQIYVGPTKLNQYSRNTYDSKSTNVKCVNFPSKQTNDRKWTCWLRWVPMADQVGPLTFSKKWEDVQGTDKSLVSWWGNRPFPFGCFRFWVWSTPNPNADQTLKFQVIYYKSSGMNGVPLAVLELVS